MKFASIISLSLLISTQAFASCYETYTTKLAEVNEVIAQSNYDEEVKRAGILSSVSSTAGLVAVSTSTGGSLLFTTGSSAVTYSASKITDFYIDFRVQDDIKKAVQVRATLETSLALLKEAQIGRGPMLQRALVTVNKTISTDISLKDLAETIKSQNNVNLFCQNEESILSADGIIKSAMEDLATR